VSEWHETPISSEEELVDRVAVLANGMKFTWSDSDRDEMRVTARIIIDNVRRDFVSLTCPEKKTA
jgi:hypothetical protein